MIYVIGSIVLFIVMIALPFMVGYNELKEKKDDENLYVNRNYVREPRYFGESFRALLNKAKKEWEGAAKGTETKIHLSKNELLDIGLDVNKSPVAANNIVIYKNNVEIPAQSGFQKEVYGKESMDVSKDCWARAVAVDGNLRFGAGSKVVRWLDVEGEADIEDNAVLGISATSGTRLHIGHGCKFKRLYAPVIAVGEKYLTGLKANTGKMAAALPKPLYNEIEYNISEIAPLDDKEKRPYGPLVYPKIVVTNRNLTIKNDMIMLGGIKAKKDLTIEDNVVVLGNIFCEGILTVGSNCILKNIVFSQEDIKLGQGTQVGEQGKIKSIIARGKIILAEGVKIYGFALTDKGGETL